MRGPTLKARINDPSPADPFHHHALRPSANPRDVAPTVELAPMLAARNVEKISPGPNPRPATKKSAAFARRPIHTPTAMKNAAYAMRRTNETVNYLMSRAAGYPGMPVAACT